MGKFICFFSLVSCPSLMFAAGNSTLKEYHVKVTLFCTSDSLLTFCVILNLDRCLNACSVTHLATVSDLSKHSGGLRIQAKTLFLPAGENSEYRGRRC